MIASGYRVDSIIFLRAIMSDRITSTPLVTPQTDHQEASPPSSTAQTDSRLTSTNTHESEPSEPTLSNKEAPKSPLDADEELTTVGGSVLEHSAPYSRDHSTNAGLPSAPTITAGPNYITLTITALTELALSGDIKAQIKLGERYYFGEGVAVNHIHASVYFRFAAELGNESAQFNLGTMYLQGEGVEKNEIQAIFWYQKAAKQHNSQAQYNLGRMYQTGDGVPKDELQAVNFFLDSADLGNADAQLELGYMYAKGMGVERDEKKACEWYLKAASQDNVDAQFELGLIYRTGNVVDKDIDQSIQWFSKAAKQGLHVAQLALVATYFTGPEKYKNPILSCYWLLKSGLHKDSQSIELHSFRISVPTFSSLVKLFPEVLVKFTEFKKVRSIQFRNIDVSDQGFLSVGELIRANTALEFLIFSGGKFKNANAIILAQSLEKNTTLIELSYVGEIDENIKDQIFKSLEQNRSIAKLRKYMLDYPIKQSDVLPLEVLEILVDKMIVSYLKSGHSFEDTVNAINEFLVSAGINGVMMDLKPPYLG